MLPDVTALISYTLTDAQECVNQALIMQPRCPCPLGKYHYLSLSGSFFSTALSFSVWLVSLIEGTDWKGCLQEVIE